MLDHLQPTHRPSSPSSITPITFLASEPLLDVSHQPRQALLLAHHHRTIFPRLIVQYSLRVIPRPSPSAVLIQADIQHHEQELVPVFIADFDRLVYVVFRHGDATCCKCHILRVCIEPILFEPLLVSREYKM